MFSTVVAILCPSSVGHWAKALKVYIDLVSNMVHIFMYVGVCNGLGCFSYHSSRALSHCSKNSSSLITSTPASWSSFLAFLAFVICMPSTLFILLL